MAPRNETDATMDGMDSSRMVVGVISDTHGRLSEDVRRRLAGVDHILHAGDVGKISIVADLAEIAPVTAVAGNMDAGRVSGLPPTVTLMLGGVRVALAHKKDEAVDAARREGWPVAASPCALVIVSGHTHRAEATWSEGVLYLNPGAAGPDRYGLGRSLLLLRIVDGKPSPEIVRLT